MFQRSLQTQMEVSPTVNNSQVANAVVLGSAMASQAGIIDIRSGQPIEHWPHPEHSTYSIANPATALKSADVYAYIFNEDALKNTLTDNTFGEGAADADKPAISYNDGFSGKLINRAIDKMNLGRGLHCEEITIIGKDGDGNQADDAILQMDASIVSFDLLRGVEKPSNIDLGAALRSSAFKNGMVTVKVDIWFNALTQMKFFCEKGFSYDVKFKWSK